MTWTTEKPTKEGWYWYRENESYPWRCRHIVIYRGSLMHEWADDFYEMCDGQWSSDPIPLPDEPQATVLQST